MHQKLAGSGCPHPPKAALDPWTYRTPLVVASNPLEDDRTLASYDIQQGFTLRETREKHMMVCCLS
jgi:hypothetical protein